MPAPRHFLQPKQKTIDWAKGMNNTQTRSLANKMFFSSFSRSVAYETFYWNTYTEERSTKSITKRDMRSTLTSTLLLYQVAIVAVNAVSIGIIRNASLNIVGASATTVNGTCEECVCTLIANSTFFSLNCFPDNLTCQLHSVSDRNQPFSLIDGVSTLYYFLSLPTFVTPVSTESPCTPETTGTSISQFQSSAEF